MAQEQPKPEIAVSEQHHDTPKRNFRTLPYLYLTVLLAVLGTALEMVFPGCPGQVSFVILLAPTLMAALEGGYRSALITGLACGLGCLGAAWTAFWLSPGQQWGWVQVLLPVPWGVMLVSCGVWFGASLDTLRQRAKQLEAQCEAQARSIYQIHKDAESQPAAEKTEIQESEAQRVEFSVLLLNIQHLGRQLSGNLEMQAAYSLVIEAARKLLKAPHPRLFLLDHHAQELVEHTPGLQTLRVPADQGMLGWVAQHGQILAAEDLEQDYALGDLQAQDPTSWKVCAPLIVGGRVLGVLAIDAIEEKIQQFDRLLYIVANFSAVALNNGRLFQRVAEMARRDGLTGLLNHATLQSKLSELISEAQDAGRKLSLVLLDVDHFKQFNDRHGHQAGDHVLRSVAQLCRRLLPVEAIAARYGGEEFICVLPGADRQKAVEQAEQLRSAFEQHAPEFDGTRLQVTASFGVAEFPGSATNQDELIRQSDKALYEAKRRGRNRVCAAPARRKKNLTGAETNEPGPRSPQCGPIEERKDTATAWT